MRCRVAERHGHVVYATVVENGGAGCASNINAATLESFGSVVAMASPNCSVGATVSHGQNWSGDDSCGFADPTDRTGTAPVLGSLADNGGPTLTLLPLAGSPLIDAIPVGACSADGAASIVPLVDQRSVARPSGAGCDIGAVEVEVPLVAVPTLLTPRFTG